MEEREKEAIEFFKSETESEGELDTSVVNEPILENSPAIKITVNNPVLLNLDVEQISDEIPQDILGKTPKPLIESDLSFKRLTEKYNVDAPTIEIESVPVSNSNNFEENSLELDEFDAIVDSGKGIILQNEEHKLQMPSLIVGKDLVIDLETGGVAEKPLTGAEMLFQRFLKNTTIQKQKSSTCMR